MLTDVERHEIVMLCRDNTLTLQLIGDHFGITRERVRQIALAAGLEPRNVNTRNRILARMKKIAEQKNAKIQQRLSEIEHLSRLWKAGATFPELAIEMGYPHYKHASSRINWLRRHYPSKFPYRNSEHWVFTDKNSRRKKVTDMSHRWKQGATAREIAKEFGYSNAASANQSIQYYRRRHPALFPFRPRKMRIKLRPTGAHQNNPLTHSATPIRWQLL